VVRRLRTFATLSLTVTGRFKYSPSSLSRILFPPPPPAAPQADKLPSDPSRYLPERERPKKRRKLVADADADLCIELETPLHSLLVLTRPVIEDGASNDKGRRWDLKLQTVAKGEEETFPKAETAYTSLAESAFLFLEEEIHLWVDNEQNAPETVPISEEGSAAKKPVIFKAWRWRLRTPLAEPVSRS
jgi:hypothetical protein